MLRRHIQQLVELLGVHLLNLTGHVQIGQRRTRYPSRTDALYFVSEKAEFNSFLIAFRSMQRQVAWEENTRRVWYVYLDDKKFGEDKRT